MKLFHFLSVIIVFLSFIGLSCKKEKTILNLSQGFKDYTVFNKNSYWIYVNDSSGIPDSSYVKDDPFIYYSPNGNWSEEVIEVRVESGFFKGFYLRHQCSTEVPNEIDESQERLYFYHISPTGLMGSVFAMWHNGPVDKDTPDPCNCSPEYCPRFKSEFLPEMTVLGTSYLNVLHTNLHSQDTSLASPGFFSYHFYFVRYIGLIRFQEVRNTIQSNRSYSLKRWNVSQ